MAVAQGRVRGMASGGYRATPMQPVQALDDGMMAAGIAPAPVASTLTDGRASGEELQIEVEATSARCVVLSRSAQLRPGA
jgi:hypothetical protein